MATDDFYVRPRGHKRRNVCAPQNPEKKHRRLRKMQARLQSRRDRYVKESSGGHECHRPGSMKSKMLRAH